MSVSYTARVIWGVQLSDSDLLPSKPNPAWDGGKTKFDPQTGNRITETIVTKIYPGDLEAKFKLQYSETYNGQIVFGLAMSNSIDLNHGNLTEVVRIPTPAQLEMLRERVKKLLAHLGLEDIEPRPYLVCNVN